MNDDAMIEEEKIDLVVSGESTESSSLPVVSDQLDLKELLGKGGMGAVYRAYDQSLGKEVAVKILQSGLAKDTAALKRFEQEAEAASKLSHPNLVSVYRHGKTSDDAPYIVMDLCQGQSLADILKESGALKPKRVLNLAYQIADALSHAHERGVVHRDIKPTNIIVSKSANGTECAQIVDFGIAKIMPTANRTTHNLTETGEVFGSPNYMSPEQCLGFMMDNRSDVYSFGCMLYELMTGEPPYAGSNPIQVVVKHINDEVAPFPITTALDKVGGGLETVTLRCLEKDQGNRYQKAIDLVKDLNLIKQGKSPVRYRKKVKQKREFTKRQVIGVIVGIAALSFYSMVSAVVFAQLMWIYVIFFLVLNGLLLGGIYVSYGAFKDIWEGITDGLTTATKWWQLILSGSFAAMCTTVFPFIFVSCLYSMLLFLGLVPNMSMPPFWDTVLKAAAIVNIVGAASCLFSLIGMGMFGGKKKVGPRKVLLQYLLIGFILTGILWFVFPGQMTDLIIKVISK